MDHARLRDGLLRPSRTHLAEARELLAESTAPDTVWRTLMGHDPRRTFLHGSRCTKCRGGGTEGGYHDSDLTEWGPDAWTCGRCRATGLDPSSPTLPEAAEQHVLTIATAPEAARQAEENAWRIATILEPWGVPHPERLVWRAAGRTYLPGLPDPFQPTVNLLFFTHWKADLDSVGKEFLKFFEGSPTHLNPHHHARNQLAWETAAQRGYTVPEKIVHYNGEKDMSTHPLVGRPFSELPNPYTPLLDIWRLGFVFEGITKGVIQLYAAK
ncbi:hypothetical protein [Spirillospora sp. CA-294931]|uniref:hypothetical protein n=1 Tax=Spirillospora sp. CA-294931 TaxID=3240042 RepID=UPI003D8FD18F